MLSSKHLYGLLGNAASIFVPAAALLFVSANVSIDLIGTYALKVSVGTVLSALFLARHDSLILTKKNFNNLDLGSLLWQILIAAILTFLLACLIQGLAIAFLSDVAFLKSIKFFDIAEVVLFSILISASSVIINFLIKSDNWVGLCAYRVALSFGISSCQIFVFYYWGLVDDLFRSHLLGVLLSQFIFAASLKRILISLAQAIKYFPAYARLRYKAFLKFDAGLFLSHLSAHAPLLVAGAFYTTELTAIYFMASRFYAVPVTLVNRFFLDFFKRDYSEGMKQGSSLRTFLRYLKILSISSLVISSSCYFLFSVLWPAVFPADWNYGLLLFSILAPMIFLRIIASPLSVVTTLQMRPGVELLNQILLVILIVFSVAMTSSFEDFIISYCYSYITFYLVVLILSGCLSAQQGRIQG